MRKKESYDVKGMSLMSDIISKIPTVRMFKNEFQIWCSNFTTIQRLTDPGSSFYETGLGVCKKIEDFGRGRRENEIERKKKHRDVSQV